MVEVGENVVILTEKCNQDCIFCSARDVFYRRVDSPREIEEKIFYAKTRISFEGGEPTLSGNLLRWVKEAKKQNISEIILCTNGIALADREYVKDLQGAGINLFNINFPSHREDLYRVLTRSYLYKNVITGIENLLSLGPKDIVRLTFVINSLNYKTMLWYTRYIEANFPQIFYIGFNFIKVLGYVKRRTYLVPRLSEVKPYLLAALEFCRINRVKAMVDGIPLCLMTGYEEYSIDLFKVLNRKYKSFREKVKTEKCKRCIIRPLCSGLRRDYLKMYGDTEVNPVVGDREFADYKIRQIVKKGKLI